MTKQSLQDAPASVTIVTAEQIRRYGYRTLGEVLSNVRGFYSTSDGPFTFVGARGFSLLGDFNTRFLVSINGHQLTDNVYGAMYYFGQDFPLDLDLVEKIEIVRGPSSALYGGHGIFATINVITKSPSDAAESRVSTTFGSFGELKLTASTSAAIGPNAKLVVSGSVLHTRGRSVDLVDSRNDTGRLSQTVHVGNESGYRFFSDFCWKNWTVTALFGQRKAAAPSGWYSSELGNTGTTDLESRNYVEAAWRATVGENSSIEWRSYYDQFRYDGVFDYGEGQRNFDGAVGDWVGSQLVFHHPTTRNGTLTLGGDINLDIRNLQYNFDLDASEDGPTKHDIFRKSHPRAAFGIFAQQEIELTQTWTAYLGGRVDRSNYDAPFLSPRAALIHRRGPTAHKFMYGRAFRNPSTFERYWEPNPLLHAESIDTVEVVREQNLHRKANLITSIFHYRLGGLIVGVPVRFDTLQYQNQSRASATGLEMEINGQPTNWLETSASFSIERTRGLDGDQQLENSPLRLGRFRASVPLIRQHLLLGGAVRYMSARLDARGQEVPGATVADLTLTAPHLHPRLEFQLGIRNLFNSTYSDPLSPEHATNLMPAAGRSMFVRITWQGE